MEPTNYVERTEDFDVVMVKNGRTLQNVLPEDCVRLPIVAKDPSTALSSAKREGYYPFSVTKPGLMSDIELAAARRATSATPRTQI